MQTPISELGGVPLLVLGAIITATATLTAALLTWFKDRSGAARRVQALDEATKYLAFWKLAIEMRKDAGDPPPSDAPALLRRLEAAEAIVESRGTARSSRIATFASKLSARIIVPSLAGLLLLLGLIGIRWLLQFIPLPEDLTKATFSVVQTVFSAAVIIQLVTLLLKEIIRSYRTIVGTVRDDPGGE